VDDNIISGHPFDVDIVTKNNASLKHRLIFDKDKEVLLSVFLEGVGFSRLKN
jgi:hypothetical protein